MKKCSKCGSEIESGNGDAIAGAIWSVLILACGIWLSAPLIRQAWQEHLYHKWSMEHGRGYWARQTAIYNAQIETQIRKHK